MHFFASRCLHVYKIPNITGTATPLPRVCCPGEFPFTAIGHAIGFRNRFGVLIPNTRRTLPKIPDRCMNLVCRSASLAASCRRQPHSSCGVVPNSAIDPRSQPFAPLPRRHGFVPWAAAMEPVLAVVVPWVAMYPRGVALADPSLAGHLLVKVVRA